VLPKILPHNNDERRRSNAYDAVLRYESKVGGQLFGPVPAGHRREFFCLDKYTWVWHEEWTNTNGKHQVVTTHYHVRPNGILKTQGNQTYQSISRDELRNFHNAVKLYGQRIPVALQARLQVA